MKIKNKFTLINELITAFIFIFLPIGVFPIFIHIFKSMPVELSFPTSIVIILSPYGFSIIGILIIIFLFLKDKYLNKKKILKLNIIFLIFNFITFIVIIYAIFSPNFPLNGTCIGKNSKILTNNGLKLIQNIKENDIVLSYDQNNNLIVENEVLKIKKHEKVLTNIFKIDNTILRITDNHLIYIFDKKCYIQVCNLKENNLIGFKKKFTVNNMLKNKKVMDVYDIEVKTEPKNFIVDGFVVHNKVY